MDISAIILAAGVGTRMRSRTPKPLHSICGRPMLLHVVHALESVRPTATVVVVGHGGDLVSEEVARLAPEWAGVRFAEQVEQNGTGDATAVGMARLDGDDYDDSVVLVLPGDTPLLRAETLAELTRSHQENGNAATVLTSTLDDPTGYGRVVRAADGRVLRVVEQRDASPEELDIKEWNTGVYAFRRDLLGPALRNLDADNSQGEYYLTDVIAQLADLGHRVGCVRVSPAETPGGNDRWQLALAEREMRNRTNRHWLSEGVTMLDPRQTFLDVTVTIGTDVTLYPGTILRGTTSVGDGSRIGPFTHLEDCVVGRECVVENTVGAGATVGDAAHVGPFAHLPAGATVPSSGVSGTFYTASDDR